MIFYNGLLWGHYTFPVLCINMNRLRKSITYQWTKTRIDSRQILITEFHSRLRLRWVKYKSNIYIYKNLTCMVEKGFFIINTSLKRTSPYKASCIFMVTYVILFLKYSGNLCCGVRIGTPCAASHCKGKHKKQYPVWSYYFSKFQLKFTHPLSKGCPLWKKVKRHYIGIV